MRSIQAGIMLACAAASTGVSAAGLGMEAPLLLTGTSVAEFTSATRSVITALGTGTTSQALLIGTLVAFAVGALLWIGLLVVCLVIALRAFRGMTRALFPPRENKNHPPRE